MGKLLLTIMILYQIRFNTYLNAIYTKSRLIYIEGYRNACDVVSAATPKSFFQKSLCIRCNIGYRPSSL